jgi:hypothetical protein
MTRLGIDAREARKTLNISSVGERDNCSRQEDSKWFIKRGVLFTWYMANLHGELY